MNNAQKIVLRRLHKIFIPLGAGEPRPEFAASLTKNLESIGFTFSAAALERLQKWTPEELLNLAESLIPSLLKMVGGEVKYSPMYPNFPAQVMEASEAELYLNAKMHYEGDAVGSRFIPQYQKQKRKTLPVQGRLTALEPADDQEVESLCRRLIRSNSSLSPSDQKDLRGLLEACRTNLVSVLPETIPFKETQATVCRFLLDRTKGPVALLSPYLRTATDVLRFATELSGGDTSLSTPAKYRSFSRRERRVILAVLENVQQPDEDMNRFRGKWIRLAERLHPGDFSKRFPNSYRSFSRLRNSQKATTFNSRVEASLNKREWSSAVHLLKQRPGELARRLDHLLREAGESTEVVLQAFAETAAGVSTPVLLQVMAHFKARSLDQVPRQLKDAPPKEALRLFRKALNHLSRPFDGQEELNPLTPMRTVFPKGRVAKLVRIPLPIALIPASIANRVVDIAANTAVERFSALPPLGRCYVAPELKTFTVPFSQRSASKSLRTLARGSRFPLPKSKVIRFFLWWKEGVTNGRPTGRVDLDLSATIFGAHWNYLDHLSYTHLKSARLGSSHSGDITSAPEGASEFIDVDIDRIRKAGGRYIFCSVQSYTSHPFSNLPQCYVGWMPRRKPQSGEIFEPASVQDKIDVASDRRISIPMLIDLKEGTAVWADLALKALPQRNINIESNLGGMAHYGIGITSMVKPNLYDLFSLHVKARGESVQSGTNAESVFSIATGTTPFDFETIVSDFLG